MSNILKISSLKVNDWRSISENKVDFLRNGHPRSRSIFVGENGAGKTSLLRAIALSLVPDIEANALTSELTGIQRRKNKRGVVSKESSIEIELVDQGFNKYKILTKVYEGEDGREIIKRETIPSKFPWNKVFLAGYGVGRGIRGTSDIEEYDRKNSVLSLFKDNAQLFDAEVVLKSVKLNGISGAKFPSLKFFEKSIRSVYRLNPNHKIEINGLGVFVHGPWGSQPFNALGDGYRSSASWILDFLGRYWSFSVKNAEVNSGEPEGIVIVDEVDEHLHPSWAQEILEILQKNFPKVQFIFTTHSPIPIVNVDPDELILVEQKNTLVTIHQNLADTSAKTIDSLLRGRWFGLKRTMDSVTEKIYEHYQEALKKGDDAEIADARSVLMLRAPSLCATPLEEAAIRAAENLRKKTSLGEQSTDFESNLFEELKKSLD